MDPLTEFQRAVTPRTFLGRSAVGIGGLALAWLLNGGLSGAEARRGSLGTLRALHHAPRARRVIFLFMSGGPSHLDLFDPKPRLRELQGKPLPPSLLKG